MEVPGSDGTSVPNSDLASPSVLSPTQRLCDLHRPNLLTLCVSSMKGLNPGFLLLDPLTRPCQNSTHVRSSMLARSKLVWEFRVSLPFFHSEIN